MREYVVTEKNDAFPEDGHSDKGEADLLVVQEAAKLLSLAVTPEVAINGMLRLLSQLLGLNRGRVLLLDPERESLSIHYSYGLTEEEKTRGKYALGEGITGKVMKSGQPAVVQNIDDEPLYLTRAVERETLPQEVVAFIAVPIFQENIPIGVLAAHRLRKRKRAISRDLGILRIIATMVAQILRLHDLIREQANKLEKENHSLRQALEAKSNDNHGILGESPALKHAIQQAGNVAPTQATVFLSGESGTGKERFARAIHLISPRKDGPFIAINCAAIPKTLLESELFGHEKGSFTGASQMKKGKIELSHGGSLFLDEIGDLDFDLQSKLLRVLEKSVIQRVGGNRDLPVDVRIITATHKNLHQAVNEGRFRIDLFYRLNVFPIHLPPLRDREGDVRILARHFLMTANHEFGKNAVFGPGAIERLDSYNWPGNIRQLENVIKRSVLVAQNDVITTQDIETILKHESYIEEHVEAGMAKRPVQAYPPAQAEPSPSFGAGMKKTATGNGGGFGMQEAVSRDAAHRPYNWVKEDEKEQLIEALRKSGGNKTRAAHLLGMTPRQYRYRLEKLKIEV